MATKRLFRGVKVSWDETGGTTFVPIGDVRNVTPAALTRDEVDVTVADSPNGYREKLRKSFRDGGQFMFTIFFNPGVYEPLLDNFQSDTTTAPNWKFEWPPADAETTPPLEIFHGWILNLTKPQGSTEDADAWQVEVTVTITGPVTFNPGAP